MSTEDWGEDPAESTFADVLNGFTLSGGSGRSRRGRPERDGRHVEQQPAAPEPPPDQQAAEQEESSAAIVRAYAWTGGRTRSEVPLQIETLVSTSEHGSTTSEPLQAEYRAIADLCAQTRSVAEIAALLSIPLGVSKVLVGDMASLGLVFVHAADSTGDGVPNLGLMERVLSGLRRL
ncbi:DUF742 domain-containing protein [Kutzneria kofuensis]|uniref:DUF742 domain-containing protein n=1 Tax=Kutzneria kofuensis TaxID=103725 RepID=A0A7W9NDY5_9PSEU|nr:DUF742 domain-containing protein [Kutzneria kofuensis]MBB5889130.1 hypothetical protein [Kutzneria kofuensis]